MPFFYSSPSITYELFKDYRQPSEKIWQKAFWTWAIFLSIQTVFCINICLFETAEKKFFNDLFNSYKNQKQLVERLLKCLGDATQIQADKEILSFQICTNAILLTNSKVVEIIAELTARQEILQKP